MFFNNEQFRSDRSTFLFTTAYQRRDTTYVFQVLPIVRIPSEKPLVKDKVIKEMKNVWASYTYGFIIRRDSFGEKTVGVKTRKLQLTLKDEDVKVSRWVWACLIVRWLGWKCLFSYRLFVGGNQVILSHYCQIIVIDMHRESK